MYELFAITTGSATSALLLAAEHFLLWSQKDQMGLTGRYEIGTATLGLGEGVAILLLANRGALRRWTAIAAVVGPICVGGVTIKALHYWRRSRGQSPWPDTLFEAGRATGVAEERRRNGTAREH